MSENIREEIWDAIYKNQRGGLFSKDIMLNQILSHLKSQIEQMEKPSTWKKETMDFHAGYYTATRDICALFSKEVKNG